MPANAGSDVLINEGRIYKSDRLLGPVDIYLAAIMAAARLMFALKLSAVLS
jgi:hypothetical protein